MIIHTVEEKIDKTKKAERAYWVLGLRIMSDFGLAIAVPVVALVLIGRYLDRRWASGPIFIIAAFALALAISAVSIYRKAKRYGKEYKDIDTR